MKNLLLFIVFLISLLSYAQYEITIEALVIDETTKSPIPYVNIGFVQKGIGTVSNEKGYFVLKYDEESVWEKELLQFSVLGYETFNVEANKLFDLLSETNKIYLKPKALSLEEILITEVITEDKQIGTLNTSGGTIGYWKDKVALGGEIATRLRIKKKKSRLKELNIRVLENLSDSLRLRINVYDYDKRRPGRNLLNVNIFHSISVKKGIEKIDLRPYNIIVNSDVIVSIEVVEVFGDQIGFVVGGLKKTGITNASTYTRYISQDKWKKIDGVAMNFSVLTSYPKSSKNFSKDRVLPNKISLFWDVSNSMKTERNTERELNYITKYLKEIERASVKVIKFSANTDSVENFQIIKGNTDKLVKYLENTDYDGATDYSKLVINPEYNPETVLLFTDGNATLGNLNLETDAPIFCVSSSAKTNHAVLQDISLYSDGHYINLYKNTVNNALNFILKEVKDEEIYDTNNQLVNAEDNIYGKILDSIYPIKGASIKVENSFKEIISEADGTYSISAEFGDVLIVNHLGMKPRRVVVSHKRNINISLTSDGVLLEEVLIKSYSKKKEDISEIFAGDGLSRAGGVTIFTEKDIKPSDLFIDDILRRVPGVLVTGPRGSPRISVRGNSRSPLILLNGGFIVDISVIDPRTIEGIAVIKSLADANKYGAAGAAGVILIRTKTSSTYNDYQGNRINSALVTGNDYNEDLPVLDNIKTATNTNYLLKATSLDDALSLYKKEKNSRALQTVPFYIDASESFMKWDKDIAYLILSNIADIAYDNHKALKALAYKLEELGKFKEAKYIYERIAQLRPKDAQSYRDLALIYQSTGAYEEAMALYKQMLANAIENVNFSGLEKTIINELKHLLKFHKSKVSFQDLPAPLLKVDFKQDIRIVFEWNNSSTEFEIQFVDPTKKYFTWQHTILNNKDRLLNEIETGYFTEEFLIDDSLKGQWVINVQCLNEEPPLNPTFLKYTVYRNFGLKNQTKDVRVIKLFGLQQKVTIDKFIYN